MSSVSFRRLRIRSLIVGLFFIVSDIAIAAPRGVLLVGGLAGSGKTVHMDHLVENLPGVSILRLDKDIIAEQSPGTSSAEIYQEMIKRANSAAEDIVIFEGNILGNLSLFRDYVLEQHQKGAKVYLVDVRCENARIQHQRLFVRGAERDRAKFDYGFYITTDRPTEEGRRDKQLEDNKDLIEQGALSHIIINNDTHDNSEPTITKNLKPLRDDLREQGIS